MLQTKTNHSQCFRCNPIIKLQMECKNEGFRRNGVALKRGKHHIWSGSCHPSLAFPPLLTVSLAFPYSMHSFPSIEPYSLFPIAHFPPPSAFSFSLDAGWCYLCANHVKSIHVLKLPVGYCDVPLCSEALFTYCVASYWITPCVLRTETEDRLK